MSLSSRLRGLGARSPRDQTEAILERHLTRDFTVFPMAERRTSKASVRALGQRLGFELPPELLAHLSGVFPGLYLEAKKEIWPRPEAYDVGPFWSFLYALHTYTAAEDSEDWMRMEVAARLFTEDTGLRALPVLRCVGDRNIYCLTEQSRLARFDHEQGILEPVELDFFQLLEREVSELRERTEKKKRGEG